MLTVRRDGGIFFDLRMKLYFIKSCVKIVQSARNLKTAKNVSLPPKPQCLKIAQKVAFNMASEASYVFCLSEQKLIENAKMVHFGEFWKI